MGKSARVQPRKKKVSKIAPVNGSEPFLRLKPILAILEAAIGTGRVANARPVSIMLVAQQESAKTESLKHFYGTGTLEYNSDLTSRGIRPYREKIQSGKMRHLVLLDLVRIVSHGRGVSERTLQTLAALMEEGETATSDAGGLESWQGFPKIGVLTSLTPDFFHQRRGHWRRTGFLTRFLPVSFTYNDGTVREIHESISEGTQLPLPIAVKLPASPVKVTIPRVQSQKLAWYASDLGKKTKTWGFRYHKAMRYLAMSLAMLDKRKIVEDQDIQQVIEWSDFFTMKEVEL